MEAFLFAIVNIVNKKNREKTRDNTLKLPAV